MRKPMSVFWLLALLALAIGCGASQRDRTIHASFVTVTAARDAFTAMDAEAQRLIVDKATSRESGESALAEYRARREVIVVKLEPVFERAFRLVGIAALANDDASMAAMRAAIADLKDALVPILKEPK